MKFSDGTPVTADDVAYSLRLHLDPKVASQAASYVQVVKTVTATGPAEVTVVLKAPTVTFLSTATQVWQVVPEKLAKVHPKDLGSPQVGTLGSGPCKVRNFSLADGTVLVRNPHYRGPKPALSKIVVKAIADAESLRLAVGSHAVDGTTDVQNTDSHPVPAATAPASPWPPTCRHRSSPISPGPTSATPPDGPDTPDATGSTTSRPARRSDCSRGQRGTDGSRQPASEQRAGR
ncbi:ABC transporter substrate-binding protein [Streptomyces atratus]|uniref:ABC transporter substrate-binding protein n=1 Tax=Streptomyces atratus TaxID=1893 RepID=UPI0035711120